MKKLIAILTIAIVLVGAVFADATSTGASSIKITTSVSEIEPTFRLKAGEVTSDLAAAANAEAVASITAAALAGNTSYVIAQDELLSAAQTVTFYVQQISRSKSIKTYTFSAAATDLVLYKYKDTNGDDVLVSEHVHPATEAEKKFTVGATTVNTFANGALAEAKATYGGTTSAKTVQYLGNAQPASAESPVNVVSFTCTWAANNDAVTGDYQATVTLTISAN